MKRPEKANRRKARSFLKKAWQHSLRKLSFLLQAENWHPRKQASFRFKRNFQRIKNDQRIKPLSHIKSRGTETHTENTLFVCIFSLYFIRWPFFHPLDAKKLSCCEAA